MSHQSGGVKNLLDKLDALQDKQKKTEKEKEVECCGGEDEAGKDEGNQPGAEATA